MPEQQNNEGGATRGAAESLPRIRWLILGLLVSATIINYVDRQTLSVLGTRLRLDLHLSESDYANAVTAFLIPYTIMYTVSGRLIDRLGVRMGMALCFTWWSLSTMLTSVVTGARSLQAARFVLGIGEPGVFPAGIKACREWFPKRERAMATGIFSSGSAVGAVVAPPVIAWLTLHVGWRYAFLIPGSIGLVWLPFWLAIYRRPAQAATDAGVTVNRPSWRQLLVQRKVWGLVLPRLVGDPVWYFYLFWLPDYLQRARHLSLTEIAMYGWIPFLAADVGNVGGGALSDWLIRRGVGPVRARFALLVGVGLMAPFGAMVGFANSAASAIAITSLVALLCQCWATNVATLVTEVVAPAETATVAGMAGTAGSFGGAIFAQVLGVVIGQFGYTPAFVVAAALHPAAVLSMVFILRPHRLQGVS